MLTCFPGWTYEYIDINLDMTRLAEINEYQEDFPPLHMLVAAYMGIGKDKKENKSTFNNDDSNNFGQLIKSFPSSPYIGPRMI